MRFSLSLAREAIAWPLRQVLWPRCLVFGPDQVPVDPRKGPDH